MNRQRLARGFRCVIVGGLIVSGMFAFLGAVDFAPRQAEGDPFEQVDLEFRGLYAAGRVQTFSSFGPVIVVEMDQLILMRNDKRNEASVIPKLYHRLKAVSHIPLGIYVALAPFGEKPLEEPRKAALLDFQKRIAAVVAALDGSGFSAEQVARSRSLLNRCATFLEEVQRVGSFKMADLHALTKASGPIVIANASDAARVQIDAYHVQVTAWRKEIPAEEWSKLRVLVLGPQMPRKHNVAVQYFAKMMNLAGESRRLVYAEELTGEQQGLNLLATHQLDSELSEAFFGDRERMEIDLIGNAASVYLDGLDLRK